MSKFISKKFFALILGTILLIIGKISEITWLYIILLYIGVEGGLDFIRIKNSAYTIETSKTERKKEEK